MEECKPLIVGRKAFFILVITKFNKSFMKTAESLAGGVLRTRTRPTFSLLVLLRESVSAFILEGRICSV